ncbi:MAG: serine hydrolase domain-containing protein [Longimicrobiales bacterium]
MNPDAVPPFPPRGAAPRPLLRAILLALVPALGAGCSDSPTGNPFANDQGIDPAALESAYETARGIPGSFSLLVQRNGTLVAEEYFHGFTPDSLHDVRSVTKSVISALVGIAIEEGFLPSVDEPIGTYLAPVVDSIRGAVAEIPVRFFLMMSSGLDWHELDRGSSYSDWWASDDMVQHVVDLPIVHEPGARFIYNTGASHLLSVALSEATGLSTLDFAHAHLFDPMGFSGASWLQENRGYYTGGMGLRITARDMMKFGQMFLDGGVYRGTRILPMSWVSESTAQHLSTRDAIPFGPGYGYLWWVGEGGGRDFYLANGYGGQFILVDPDLALVVVAQSDWRGKDWDEAGEQWYEVLSLIVEEILPGVH